MNNFHDNYWTSLSYAIMPLLPVSFTLFWKLTTLHGTVCLIKMIKCLKKLVSSTTRTSVFNDQNQKSDKKSLGNKKSSLNKGDRELTRSLLDENQVKEMENFDTSAMDNSHNKYNDSNISDLNELSTIRSLLDSLPFNDDEIVYSDDLNNSEKLTNKDQFYTVRNKLYEGKNRRNFIVNYFFKLWKNIKFYFKIIRLISSLSSKSFKNYINKLNDNDLMNAPFIYYSNFLIGLGTITVSY